MCLSVYICISCEHTMWSQFYSFSHSFSRYFVWGPVWSINYGKNWKFTKKNILFIWTNRRWRDNMALNLLLRIFCVTFVCGFVSRIHVFYSISIIFTFWSIHFATCIYFLACDCIHCSIDIFFLLFWFSYFHFICCYLSCYHITSLHVSKHLWIYFPNS